MQQTSHRTLQIKMNPIKVLIKCFSLAVNDSSVIGITALSQLIRLRPKHLYPKKGLHSKKCPLEDA